MTIQVLYIWPSIFFKKKLLFKIKESNNHSLCSCRYHYRGSYTVTTVSAVLLKQLDQTRLTMISWESLECVLCARDHQHLYYASKPMDEKCFFFLNDKGCPSTFVLCIETHGWKAFFLKVTRGDKGFYLQHNKIVSHLPYSVAKLL